MAATKTKIVPLDELAAIVGEHRAQGRRVVHCHGVFDLLHPGHIRHFEAARAEGDVLVVTLTQDHLVNKGPGRPVFNERLRLESIAALASVDHVALNAWPTAVETIHLLRPDVYAKGDEYRARESDLTGAITDEERAILAEGGRMHFTADVTFSSSKLLNAHFEVFSPEASEFLERFRSRHSADELIDLLSSFQELRAVVVGDAIVDEYHFCQPYGMASKSATLAAQLEREETYAGGALAVANHLAGFCGEVELVTCLGELDEREDWVRAHLKPNVRPSFHVRPGAPTTTKRRYVSGSAGTKLFEVSRFADDELPQGVENDVARDLAGRAGEADLVIVADFGYRLLGPRAIDAASASARFLAVNAQSNAANYGYNDVTRYARADYVCVDSEEARIAYRNRSAPLGAAVEALARDLEASVVAVTQGSRGALVRRDGETVEVPVFSGQVVDPVGAGDAFLAVTAPAALRGASAEVLGFVGNAVGALAVRIVGNKESVEPTPLYRFVTTLLK